MIILGKQPTKMINVWPEYKKTYKNKKKSTKIKKEIAKTNKVLRLLSNIE